MKKIASLLLCMCMGLSLTAFAVEARVGCAPRLSFSGTTANIEVTVQGVGCDIEATVQLWCGNSMLDSWEGSGRTAIVIRGSAEVERGKTYTVRVNGTIDGESFQEATITKKCP